MTQIRIKDLDSYYQKRAKEFIDLMFDTGLFNADITRDQMVIVENYLADEYQSIHDSTKMLTSTVIEYKRANK